MILNISHMLLFRLFCFLYHSAYCRFGGKEINHNKKEPNPYTHITIVGLFYVGYVFTQNYMYNIHYDYTYFFYLRNAHLNKSIIHGCTPMNFILYSILNCFKISCILRIYTYYLLLRFVLKRTTNINE